MEQAELRRLQSHYRDDELGTLKIELIKQMYAHPEDDALLAKLQAALYVLQDDYPAAARRMAERGDTPAPEGLPLLIPTDCDGLPEKPEMTQDATQTREYQDALAEPGQEELAQTLSALANFSRKIEAGEVVKKG